MLISEDSFSKQKNNSEWMKKFSYDLSKLYHSELRRTFLKYSSKLVHNYWRSWQSSIDYTNKRITIFLLQILWNLKIKNKRPLLDFLDGFCAAVFFTHFFGRSVLNYFNIIWQKRYRPNNSSFQIVLTREALGQGIQIIMKLKCVTITDYL